MRSFNRENNDHARTQTQTRARARAFVCRRRDVDFVEMGRLIRVADPDLGPRLRGQISLDAVRIVVAGAVVIVTLSLLLILSLSQS